MKRRFAAIALAPACPAAIDAQVPPEHALPREPPLVGHRESHVV